MRHGAATRTPAARRGGGQPQPAAPAVVPVVPVVPVAPPPLLSDAVAARFPDPVMNYRTPALQAGRTEFTSNAELQALVHSLAREAASTVHVLNLGASQSGVPIEALLFTRLADPQPASLQRSGRPLVLVFGQQHGDEPASSEALIVLAQELTRGRLQSLLDRINVVVLPRANPDGAQAGQRASANGVDIDRDHLWLKTPEAQALAEAGARLPAIGGGRGARIRGQRPLRAEVRCRAARRRAGAVRHHRQPAALRDQGG